MAPQSMTVVVLMICKPVASLTGKWIVLSFGKATSTSARPLASPSYPRPLFPLMSILQPFSFWCRIEFCESHALDDAEIESWTHITVWPVWPVGHHSMFNHTTIITCSQWFRSSVYFHCCSYCLLSHQEAKGKAAAPKEGKTVKIKELQISINDMSYLDFLQSILNKHGQD